MKYQIRQYIRNDFMMTYIEGEVIFSCESKRVAKLHLASLSASEKAHDLDSNVEYHLETVQ